MWDDVDATSVPLTTRLRDWGAAKPTEGALAEVRVVGQALEAETLSWEALMAATGRAVTLLRERGVPRGARVLLSVPRVSLFTPWFLGILEHGAIAVPMPSPDGFELPRAVRERILAVAEDCEPRALVMSAEVRARGLDDLGLSGLEALPAEAVLDPGVPAASTDRPESSPAHDDIALLQYTSGSTGRPRGVVVQHGNLAANVQAIIAQAQFRESDRSVSWLPLFHDMGLVGGLLVGLVLGSTPHVMEPRHFLLRPVNWLRAIDTYGASFTVAPNFAYRLCATRLSDAAVEGLDLSRLRLAFNGAEPIDMHTVRAFTERFAPCGLDPSALYPVYGLAECTLAAAFPPPGRPPVFDLADRDILASEGRAVAPAGAEEGLMVVSVGGALPGHALRIRDPESGELLPDRQTGEICVAGPSVTPGYWGAEERARDELSTGDLGYLAEGELYVVDRLKDLIIIAGRNHSPSDVERAVQSVEGIAAGAVAAFAARGDATDELWIVAALHPSSWRPSDSIRRDVIAAVRDRVGVTPAMVHLAPPGTVPKTSSGKIRRAECRRLLREGKLPSAEGVSTRASLKVSRLTRRVLSRWA